VNLNDSAIACAGVQSVDILGNDDDRIASPFQLGQGEMGRVWLGCASNIFLAIGRNQLKNFSGLRRKALSEATSIGSNLVHKPLSAERKSGIPEGVEIPAPVKATICRA
jgi:hypothetical protein